mgnify:FL=1
MNIDKTFIINLENRTDRKNKMINELKRVGITNYEFFKAIKPLEKEIKEWNINYLNPLPQWIIKRGNIDPLKYKIGSLGCLKSHYEIIKMSYDNNYENILILEDDITFLFNENFHSLLTKLSPHINLIKDCFGLLYLSGNHLGGLIKQITPNISLIKGILSTGSYIINRKAMKMIIDQLIHYDREIDVYYSNILHNNIHCFCFIPHLTKQNEDYSDILNKKVRYSLKDTLH